MIHTALVSTPIKRDAVSVANPAHGGEVHFFGVVRDLNDGRRVLAVSYEAHAPLCEATFREIAEAMVQRYGPALDVALVHRVGRLAVGEVSIAICVSSPHRDEAYRASRDIIEAVKHRAPIWKQEHYVDGDSGWVQGHALCAH